MDKLAETTEVESPSAEPKKKKRKKRIKISFVEAIRRTMLYRKASNWKWGSSKHHGSHHYPSIPARRLAKKQERQNRKRGRQ
jgi:hypothetical protein